MLNLKILTGLSYHLTNTKQSVYFFSGNSNDVAVFCTWFYLVLLNLGGTELRKFYLWLIELIIQCIGLIKPTSEQLWWHFRKLYLKNMHLSTVVLLGKRYSNFYMNTYLHLKWKHYKCHLRIMHFTLSLSLTLMQS